jgi:hypothetical protein
VTDHHPNPNIWILREAILDAHAALVEGTMNGNADRVTLFAPLLLDQQAWCELNELLDSVLARALEMQTESARRAKAGGSATFRTRLTLLHDVGG